MFKGAGSDKNKWTVGRPPPLLVEPGREAVSKEQEAREASPGTPAPNTIVASGNSLAQGPGRQTLGKQTGVLGLRGAQTHQHVCTWFRTGTGMGGVGWGVGAKGLYKIRPRTHLIRVSLTLPTHQGLHPERFSVCGLL